MCVCCKECVLPTTCVPLYDETSEAIKLEGVSMSLWTSVEQSRCCVKNVLGVCVCVCVG